MQKSILAGIAFALLPSLAHACSPAPGFTIQRWSNRVINFVGRASTATVETGPGDVKYVLENGRPATNVRIVGRRITVDRMPVYAPSLLPKGTREMIVVPWGLGAACEPVPLPPSAQWFTPGTRAIFQATLRVRSQWVNNVPTLDLLPLQRWPWDGAPPNTDPAHSPSLSVDELFDIDAFLPDPDSLRVSRERAMKPLLQWVDRHPALARRYPANEMIELAMTILEAERKTQGKGRGGGV